MNIFNLQLTEDGASQVGQCALLLVGEEPRPGPEPVTTPNQLMGDWIVRDKAMRIKTAILKNVQV